MKKSLLSFLFIIMCATLSAQDWIGVSHSNFAGTHAIYYNPASIARSRHKLYINTVGIKNSFTQDYGKLSLPFSMKDLVTGNVPAQYKDSAGNLKWDDSWLSENNSGKPVNVGIHIGARLPSVMVNWKSWGFGITNRIVGTTQFNNMSNKFVELAKNGIDTTNSGGIYSQTGSDNTFNFRINSYLETGFTVAKDIIHTRNLKIKAGITGKLIFGVASAYIKNDGFDFKVYGEDSLVVTKADLEYAHTDLDKLKGLMSNPLAIKKPQGFGVGWDVGAVVEYNPTALKSGLVTSKKNDYLFRFGLSLLNIGSVKYKQNANYYRRLTNNRVVYYPDSVIKSLSAESTVSSARTIDSLLFRGFNTVDSATTFSVGLPTSISLQFDYNVFKWFYVGANLKQSFRKKDYKGLRDPSNFTIIPRFETKYVEFALPFMLANDYKDARMGAYLRLGPVFVGTDQLASVFSNTEISGYNIYFGASAGILKKKGKRKKSIAFSDEYIRDNF